MRVNYNSLRCSFGADIACPDACKAEEETLVRSETVHLFIALSFFCTFESFVGDTYTAKVCNVFAKSKFSVYMQRIVYRVTIELLNNFLCFRNKLSRVLACPPVRQVSF